MLCLNCNGVHPPPAGANCRQVFLRRAYHDIDELTALLRDIKAVWDAEGFGSDEAVSEPLYARLCAVLDAAEPPIDDDVDHTAGVLGDLGEQTREM